MDFYEAHRISGRWHLDHGAHDVLVRGISLFAACRLYVFQLLAPELATNSQSGKVVQKIKKQGWDWHIKMVASRVALSHGATPAGTRPFVALYDTHNNAMVDSVAAVAKELAKLGHVVIPVASDPKIARRAVGSRRPIGYASCYGFRDEVECRRLWRDNKLAILSAIKSFASGHSIPGASSGYLKNCLKQTIRDIIAIDNLYRRLAPAAIFMGSDSHKLGRISALVARKHEWRSLVLQHGAPMLPHAYVPVHADHIAVWGPSFMEWFARHDVPAEKMIVTGAPRFDCYVPARREGGGKRKIVWLTTPAEEEVVSRCFDCILPALAATGLDLVIKPHPSEPPDAYARIVAGMGGTPATVVTGVQIIDLVNEGDLVFCLNSTAGIEAVALGGLLIVMSVPSVPNSIPYHSYGIARVITGASDVVARIEEFIRYSGSEEYRKEADRFLGDHLGLLDGMSARRVCRFLLDNVSPKEEPVK